MESGQTGLGTGGEAGQGRGRGPLGACEPVVNGNIASLGASAVCSVCENEHVLLAPLQ